MFTSSPVYPVTLGRFTWRLFRPDPPTHELSFRHDDRDCWLYVEPTRATAILQDERGYAGERFTMDWSEDDAVRHAFVEHFGPELVRDVAALIGRLKNAATREAVIAASRWFT